MKLSIDRILAYLVPSLKDVIWVVVLLSVIGMGSRMMNIDGDLGRHLAIGQYILDQGQIPTRDLFSHTMLSQPVTPHEWLAQVIFALAHSMMGLDGVILVCGLVIATTFGLVYQQARRAGGGIAAAALAVVLALAAASLHWLSRPHIFTFLMLALWMNVLEDLRRGRLSRWWLLPAIMLVWANLHGAFVVGFITYALYGFGLLWDSTWRRFARGEGLHGRFWRSYLRGGAAALLVTMVNPSGPGLWVTSFGYVGNRYLVGHTAEYLPPNFHEPSTWPFLLMVGLLVILLGLQDRRVESSRVIPAAAWLVMGLYSTRNIPLFAIIAAPLVAQMLAEWVAANHHQRAGLGRFYQLDQRLFQTEMQLHSLVWPVIVFIVLAAGLSSGQMLDLQRKGNRFDPQVFPVEAVNWLNDHPIEGEVFNYFPWGGYLLYRMWPEQPVFIDGQTDFYGESLTREYQQVLLAQPGWEAILDHYGVDWVIFPTGEALVKELNHHADWEKVYGDETAQIFIHTGR